MGALLADAFLVIFAACMLALLVLEIGKWALRKQRGPAKVTLLKNEAGKPTEVTITEGDSKDEPRQS